MLAADVRQVVEAEIGGNWGRTNAHGVDLRQCLVEPYRVACRNTLPRLNEGKPLDLWVVLEEKLGRHEGYVIVFDETRGWFGLAAWDGDTPVFLDFHGSFLRAFDGM